MAHRCCVLGRGAPNLDLGCLIPPTLQKAQRQAVAAPSGYLTGVAQAGSLIFSLSIERESLRWVLLSCPSGNTAPRIMLRSVALCLTRCTCHPATFLLDTSGCKAHLDGGRTELLLLSSSRKSGFLWHVGPTGRSVTGAQEAPGLEKEGLRHRRASPGAGLPPPAPRRRR